MRRGSYTVYQHSQLAPVMRECGGRWGVPSAIDLGQNELPRWPDILVRGGTLEERPGATDIRRAAKFISSGRATEIVTS